MVVDSLQLLIDALSLGGLYALMALGLALIYGILRLVNFAYGELVMVGGYSLLLFGSGSLPWILVALLSVAMVMITSLLTERIAFRPVRTASPTTMLITSFAVSALLQNAALLFISPRPRAVPNTSFLTETVWIGGIVISKANILALTVSVALLALLSLLLKRTILGLALRAAADDFLMTRLLGAAAFAISGLLAGVVALLWIGRIGSVAPTIGLTPVLIAFIATVIGGMQSLTGAVVGGYLLGFLTVGLQLMLPQRLLDFRQAFIFGIVILVLLFRPNGLISSRHATERI
jgi:branched-chain amino acid transport system permease protein